MGKKKKKLCYSVVTACRTRTGYDACENACSGESRKCAPTGCRVHAVLRIVEGFTVKTCDNCLFSCVADSVTWDEFKSRYGEPILESACLRAVTRPHAPMYPSHVANSQKC